MTADQQLSPGPTPLKRIDRQEENAQVSTTTNSRNGSGSIPSQSSPSDPQEALPEFRQSWWETGLRARANASEFGVFAELPGLTRRAVPVAWRADRLRTSLLDEQDGTDRLELTCRIMKIAEEAGEATQAWFGVLGQNPRKGVTHAVDDGVGELTDVVFTSLVAIASLGADPQEAVAAVAAKAATYRSGLATTTAGSPPTGSGTAA
ncbi:MazG-like family protein [Micromonospora tarapacensis]|uniref:MazG-like family protein n=1 Tax=Micromonospora tarapacensis TaxID=2835305 RepID=UPI001E5BDDE9|nr:MazG-like family protein [Micromonospora tarapacensis]